MAVRYVKSIHFFKAFADGFHRAGIGDGPQDVGNAVVLGEIVLRFVEFDPFPDDAGKALVLAVGQEYRFRLGGTGVKAVSYTHLRKGEARIMAEGLTEDSAMDLVQREKARFIVAEPCKPLVDWHQELMDGERPGFLRCV